jgi:hypothetical protein
MFVLKDAEFSAKRARVFVIFFGGTSFLFLQKA